MSEFSNITLELLKGFSVTLSIFSLTLLFALPLGLVIAFMSMSKFAPIKYFSKGIVWVFRGTPLMLQIIAIFYGLAFWLQIYDIIVPRFPMAIIAFTINYACYFSEIYRGGIEGIPKGQYEACFVLGMSKTNTFKRIILPQFAKRIVAPMSNEIITLVKDTTLVSVISIIEITKIANEIVSAKFIIWPMFYSGVFYLIFNGLLTLLFSYVEKKFNYYK